MVIFKVMVVILLILISSFAGVGQAFAFSLSTTCSIGVDVALALTKNADINFGTVAAGIADNYTISTAGVITNAGSGSVLAGTPVVGNITITGSTSQTVNISVGSYAANNGVTPSNATCAYNGGSAGVCSISGAAAPGAGKTLLLGVTAAVNGTQTSGSTAAPSFVVTVAYP